MSALAGLATVAAASTWHVTTNADSGGTGFDGSLRHCLAGAVGGDEIVIDLAGTVVVAPLTELPLLNGAVLRGEERLEIDGTSLPIGSRGIALGPNAELYGVIVHDAPGPGIVVEGSSAFVGSTIVGERNFSYANDGDGIWVRADSTQIIGNRVGTDVLGVVHGNCANPDDECAGIKSSEHDCSISSNLVDGTVGDPQQFQGAGIFVRGGDSVSITENQVGAAAGNSGPGIAITSTDESGDVTQPFVAENEILGSGGAGIYLGPQSAAATVRENFVGMLADGTPGGNDQSGIYVFGSSAHVISLNVVGFNAGDGIELAGFADGAWHHDNYVHANTVGATSSGGDAGNGGWGISAVGQGTGNTIASNIVAYNDVGGILAAEVGGVVDSNLVGSYDLGEPAGNGGVGIDVRRRDEVIRANDVGHAASDGILVHEPGTVVVEDVLLEDNFAHDNGGRGLAVDEGDRVELARNTARDNGSCGVVAPAVEGSREAPALLARNARAVTFEAIAPSGLTVVRVEVFWDDAGEAREYVGEAEPASLPADRWTYALPLPLLHPDGAYVAVATHSDGTSTSLTPRCGDGCGDDTNATCDDGDRCTVDSCSAGSCSHSAAANGTVCVDGDSQTTGDTCQAGVCVPGTQTSTTADPCVEWGGSPAYPVFRVCETDGDFCTTAKCVQPDPVTGDAGGCESNEHGHDCDDGNDCTADHCSEETDRCYSNDRPAGYRCESEFRCVVDEVCDGAGSCSESTGTPIVCPFEHSWRPASCTESDGCVYETDPNDGICDPLELGTLATSNVCTPLDSVDTTCQGLTDDDADGIPDEWEDIDCVDVNVNMGCDLASGEVELPDVTEGVRDIILEVDWFDEPSHDHDPSAYDEDLVNAFADSPSDTPAFALHIVGMSAIPVAESARIQIAGFAPRDPDCTEEWWPFDVVRQLHSEEVTLGIGRYAVVGHSLTPHTNESSLADPLDPTQSDGVCGPLKGGFGINGKIVVGKADFDNEMVMRGTLMHELGHVCALSHGGGDGDNRKLNLISVMNYLYSGINLPQWTGPASLGVPPGWSIDYSTEVLGVPVGADVGLDEASLDELAGLGSVDERYQVVRSCSNSIVDFLPPVGAADYNCSGSFETGYAMDTNDDGATSFLEGFDEWGLVNAALPCLLRGNFFGAIGDDDTAPEPSEEELATLGLHLPMALPPMAYEPGCSTVRVPADKIGNVRAVVLWTDSSIDPQDVDASTATLAGATSLGHVDVDANADLQKDRLFAFDVADMTLGNAVTALTFRARSAVDGRWVMGRTIFVTVPTIVDTDADGVRDTCDACPSAAAPVPDLDGCP